MTYASSHLHPICAPRNEAHTKRTYVFNTHPLKTLKNSEASNLAIFYSYLLCRYSPYFVKLTAVKYHGGRNYKSTIYIHIDHRKTKIRQNTQLIKPKAGDGLGLVAYCALAALTGKPRKDPPT